MSQLDRLLFQGVFLGSKHILTTHCTINCENALIEFMCKDLQPISVVDSPAFLKLLSTLDTRYIQASRSTFSRVIIPAKYISVKEIVLASLSTASHCTLTTDL